MIDLRNSPFLWISFVILCSYWMSEAVRLTLSFWQIWALLVLSLICSLLLMRRYDPARQFVSTVILGIFIFVSGLLRIHDFKEDHFHRASQDHPEYRQGIFKVRQVLKNKAGLISINSEVQTIFGSDSSEIFFDRNVLLNIKTTEPIRFLPGDIIRADGWLSPIKGPLNPGAFDAAAYYKTLCIRHLLYCRQENISVEKKGNFSMARITAHWQSVLSEKVKANVPSQVAQLSNALVWGDRSELDPEIRDAFADSGAMHVLSVSGMHVAIIYTILFFLLGSPSQGTLVHRIIRFSLYAAAIVLYMGLTGGSPAVVRAGVMILLYLFGKSMGWNTHIWNLMGFAAFVMLWINPFIWMNIGFQLSFLAMAGILLFAKPLIRSLSFKNLILHRCWEIAALSVAAQIFILPILLGQFHQFPLTFIMSSIAAIPASYLIILGALVNVILSFLGIDLLWPALEWSGSIFIEVMKWMSALNPLMHYSLPVFGVTMLMSMAVLFSASLVYKWPSGKKAAWLCCALTLVHLGCHRVKQWKTDDMLVYHSQKGLLMDVMMGGKCYSIMDCSLSPGYIEFITRGNRCHRDIINVTSVCTNSSNDAVQYNKYHLRLSNRVLFIWNEESIPFLKDGVSEIIMDACDQMEIFKNFIRQNRPVHVILPAHLNISCRKSIIAFLNEYSIPFHDIEADGYFQSEL